MKLAIYDEKPAKKKTVFLKLEKDGGSVDVVGVDENGKRIGTWPIVNFTEDGNLFRYNNISGEMGFKIDRSNGSARISLN